MYEGRFVTILAPQEATPDRIGMWMAGVAPRQQSASQPAAADKPIRSAVEAS